MLHLEIPPERPPAAAAPAPRSFFFFYLFCFVQRSNLLSAWSRGSLYVCAVCAVFFFPSPRLPVSPPLLLPRCASSSGVSQAFLIHFWDLRPILPHHPCVISIPPSSLPFILPRFEANSTLFTGKYRWSPHIPAIFMLFFSTLPATVHRVLSFYITFWRLFFFPLASSSCCLIISIISFSLYISLRFSCSSVRASCTPSPQPPNSCGTNRPEAEGWRCPFRLITSHLCVHKQTNITISLIAPY